MTVSLLSEEESRELGLLTKSKMAAQAYINVLT